GRKPGLDTCKASQGWTVEGLSQRLGRLRRRSRWNARRTCPSARINNRNRLTEKQHSARINFGDQACLVACCELHHGALPARCKQTILGLENANCVGPARNCLRIRQSRPTARRSKIQVE